MPFPAYISSFLDFGDGSQRVTPSYKLPYLSTSVTRAKAHFYTAHPQLIDSHDSTKRNTSIQRFSTQQVKFPLIKKSSLEFYSRIIAISKHYHIQLIPWFPLTKEIQCFSSPSLLRRQWDSGSKFTENDTLQLY